MLTRFLSFRLTAFGCEICKSLTTSKVPNAMKSALMRNRYPAPKKKEDCMVAKPYPAVQIGGIKAEAIATPGIIFPFAFLVAPTMPAIPPKKAMKASQMVGFVRAKSSEAALPNGVRAK